MKVKRTRRGDGVIIVDPGFIRISDVTRDRKTGRAATYTYEVSWSIDVVSTLRVGARGLRVSLMRTQPSDDASLWKRQGDRRQTPASIVEGIRTMGSSAKDRRVGQAADVFATRTFSIVPNLDANVSRLIANAQSEDIAVTYLPTRVDVVSRSVSSFKHANESSPILKSALNTAVAAGVSTQPQQVGYNGGNLQATAFDMLLESCIDPSDIVGSHVATVNTARAHAGLSGTDTRRNITKKRVTLQSKRITPYANMFTKPTTPLSHDTLYDDVEMPVVERTQARFVEMIDDIVVSAGEIVGRDAFYVRFEVIDAMNDVVGVVDRIVRSGKLLEVFETPTVAPIVNACVARSPGKNVFDVRQVDSQAVAIRVYRRALAPTVDINSRAAMAFSYVGEFPVSLVGGPARITDTVNNLSTVAYRFISIGRNGKVTSGFTNVVVRGIGGLVDIRRKRNTHAAIDVTPDGQRAIVRITNMAKGPVAVGIQRRNRTLYETEYSYISDSPLALSDNVEAVRFIDNSVKASNIYEYRLVVFHDDGSDDVSDAYHVYEHVNQDGIGVHIVVSDPEVKTVVSRSRGQGGVVNADAAYDVQFSVRSQIDENDFDQLRTVLARHGMETLFATELTAGRVDLSDIVAHHIKRINTADGSVDDFGVITTSLFSDVTAGRTHAVRPISPGVTYRYMITTLLRAPETLFDDLEKVVQSKRIALTSADSVTGLTNSEYSFKPSKFLHPLVLRDGTLTSKATRLSRHARDEFMYGIVGNTRVVDVAVPNDDVKVTRIAVDRVDKGTNVVRWDVVGDVSAVDYFIVSLNNLGTDQVVGRVHALSNTTSFEFIHDLGDVDVGTASYTVTLMLTNFLRGSVVESDRFVV